MDVAQLIQDQIKPYRPSYDVSRRTLDRMLRVRINLDGTETYIAPGADRLVDVAEAYFLSRPTPAPDTALPIPWTYKEDLSSLPSRRMFCALALVTLAQSKALLRSSPHLASFSVGQTSMNLTVGRFRIVGLAANSWCR